MVFWHTFHLPACVEVRFCYFSSLVCFMTHCCYPGEHHCASFSLKPHPPPLVAQGWLTYTHSLSGINTLVLPNVSETTQAITIDRPTWWPLSPPFPDGMRARVRGIGHVAMRGPTTRKENVTTEDCLYATYWGRSWGHSSEQVDTVPSLEELTV